MDDACPVCGLRDSTRWRLAFWAMATGVFLTLLAVRVCG